MVLDPSEFRDMARQWRELADLGSAELRERRLRWASELDRMAGEIDQMHHRHSPLPVESAKRARS